jgi:hypothetical protein
MTKEEIEKEIIKTLQKETKKIMFTIKIFKESSYAEELMFIAVFTDKSILTGEIEIAVLEDGEIGLRVKGDFVK